MPDLYGGLELPIVVPSATGAVADPLLDTLLAFFKAVLNARGSAAWNAIAPGTGGQVVKATFAHNPTAQAFKLASTPALYLWRQSIGRARQIAADWRIRPSLLMVRWVPFPVYQQERARRWEPFFNAIPSILDAVIERGRDPAWVMPDDDDPLAATKGSLLWRFVRVHKLQVAREEVKRADLAIPIEGERGPATSEVIDIPIELEERLLLNVLDGEMPPEGIPVGDEPESAEEEVAYARMTVVVPLPPEPSLTTNVGQFPPPDPD